MTTAVDIGALDALLWAAFEGEPGAGRREVRLSWAEAEYLHTAYSAARLSVLEDADGAGKAWYSLSFS